MAAAPGLAPSRARPGFPKNNQGRGVKKSDSPPRNRGGPRREARSGHRLPRRRTGALPVPPLPRPAPPWARYKGRNGRGYPKARPGRGEAAYPEARPGRGGPRAPKSERGYPEARPESGGQGHPKAWASQAEARQLTRKRFRPGPGRLRPSRGHATRKPGRRKPGRERQPAAAFAQVGATLPESRSSPDEQPTNPTIPLISHPRAAVMREI